MFVRSIWLAAICVSLSSAAWAQSRRDLQTFAPAEAPAEEAPPEEESNAAPPAGNDNLKWQAPGAAPRTMPAVGTPAMANAGAQPPLRPVGPAGPVAPGVPRAPVARVTQGPNSLPNDAGQVWREYDITPYTARVTSTNKPEQAVLDWIMRETGYEAWHTQPIAILSVDNHRVSVYHTPQMHAVVQEVVDRFVNTEAESHVFGMKVVTLRSPDWRAKHHKLLKPVATQTQGIQAWLVAKEDQALMLADLRRRSDFQEHGAPHLMVNNGQSKQISAMQTRNYMRDALLRPDTWPGFEPQMGQFDEGFKLEFNPLLSLDGKVVDAVIRCEVDQLEKMIPVNIDVPTSVSPRQRQKIEVPQPTAMRIHERFRWPADQVLLISMGVGPSPVPTAAGSISVPLISGPQRADLLIFVESKGKIGAQPAALQPGQREASLYQNRY